MSKDLPFTRLMQSGLLTVFMMTALPLECFASSPWQSYLDDPSGAHREQIADRINNCNKELECRKSLRPTSSELQGLIVMIGTQREGALEAGFLAVSTLVFSGGDYEDLLESIAAQSALQPRLFLKLVKKYYRIPEMLTKMPLSTVDNPSQRDELRQARIAAVQSVSDPLLAPERDWALGILRGAGRKP